MSNIVATAPAGGLPDPRHNGHCTTLIIDELGTFDPRLAPRGVGCDPTLEGPDLHAAAEMGLDPVEAWVEAVVEQPTGYTSETFAAQQQGLDDEFRDLVALYEEQVEDDILARLRDQAREAYDELLADEPRACPEWCVYADDAVHGDAFDTDPDTTEHRGVPHTLTVRHGGLDGDRPGPAQIEVQLEQGRDQASGPVVALTVTVDRAAQTAWLTPSETRVLHRALGELLQDSDT